MNVEKGDIISATVSATEDIDVIGEQNIHDTYVTQNLTRRPKQFPKYINVNLQVFVGRIKERQALIDLFERSKTCCVLISAIGGQGKTVLAKKFIQEITEQAGSFAPAVNWLNGETMQTLVNDITDYMKEIGLQIKANNQSIPTKSMIDSLSRSAHQSTKSGWIVVIDNADKKYPEFEDIVDKFVQCGSFLIITSRQVDIILKEAEHIPLRGLERDDASSLVKQLLRDEINEMDIFQFCKELESYPLGIRQAIAYIKLKQRMSHYNIKTFLVDLRMAGAKVLSENMLRDYPRSTLNIIEMTLEKIKNEENGVDAIMLLKVLSLVNADGVTKEYLGGLVKKCYKMDKIELPLILLESICFVEVFKSEETGFSIHRIVQTIVREKMKVEKELEQLLDKLLNCHEYSLVRSHISSLDRNQIQNLIQIWEHSFEFPYLVKNHNDMATDIFNRLLSLTLFRELLRFTKNISIALRNISGENDKHVLWMEYCACLGLETSGEYEEALAQYQIVWRKQVNIVGPYNAQTLLTQEQIASTLCRMKRWDESFAKHTEVYNLMLKHLPKNHSHTRITQHNIAICLKEMGRFKQALVVFIDVYQFRNKNYGSTSSWTLDTRNHIADIWFQMLSFEKANEEYEQVYNLSKNTVGELHENTMRAMEMSAKCLWEIGQKQQGYDKLSEAEKLYAKSWGLEHPTTIMCQGLLREWKDILAPVHLIPESSNYTQSYSQTVISTKRSGNFISEIINVKLSNTKGYTLTTLCELGSGAFGKVMKVENKSNQMFALKIIVFKDSENSSKLEKEVGVMKDLNPDFVVKYYNSWITENNLYIQMELCSDNLKNIIQQKSKYFKRDESKPMNTIEYFISCQLFKELLECVQYLHESKPPIIHRDLKPENILLSENQTNNRFLKLADFGLAMPLRNNTITLSDNCGTAQYMAQEVHQGRVSIKSDIYSLSIISQELYDFDIYSSDDKITKNKYLSNKWYELKKQIGKMFSTHYKTRPTCAELLAVYNEWAIDVTELKDSEEYQNYKLIEVENNQDNLFIKYLNAKLNS